jgi:hypothetical protein
MSCGRRSSRCFRVFEWLNARRLKAQNDTGAMTSTSTAASWETRRGAPSPVAAPSTAPGLGEGALGGRADLRLACTICAAVHPLRAPRRVEPRLHAAGPRCGLAPYSSSGRPSRTRPCKWCRQPSPELKPYSKGSPGSTSSSTFSLASSSQSAGYSGSKMSVRWTASQGMTGCASPGDGGSRPQAMQLQTSASYCPEASFDA